MKKAGVQEVLELKKFRKTRVKPIAIYVSGARSDYGLMKNVLRELSQSFDIRVVLTGMHLSKKFGATLKEVKDDGFKIESVIPVKIQKDTTTEMSNGMAKVIKNLNVIVSRRDVNLVIILGDRWEALATAIAAGYQKIPIAHIAGGDVSGGLDNYNRIAISIFSTYHFVENKSHKMRLIKLGIPSSMIFHVGAVAIDQIRRKQFPNPSKVLEKYNIDGRKPIILTTFHSTIEEFNQVSDYMKVILNVLSDLGDDFEKIIIYPNSDAGGLKIIKTIENHKKYYTFHIFKSIPHDNYLALMSKAALMFGNSSSFFTEGMAFKVPSINLGVRQMNRIRGINIIDCPYNEKKIMSSIRRCLSPRFKNKLKHAKNPYGYGNAAEQIHKVLKRIHLHKK